MKFYFDCEFDGFGGDLMSFALVSEDSTFAPLYVVIDYTFKPCLWVRQNVVPHLGDQDRLSRDRAARMLAAYLRQSPTRPVLVADWPEDFSHIMKLMITGPGLMVPMPDFDCEYRALKGFNTAAHSKVPHNALEDARALRDYCVGLSST